MLAMNFLYLKRKRVRTFVVIHSHFKPLSVVFPSPDTITCLGITNPLGVSSYTIEHTLLDEGLVVFFWFFLFFFDFFVRSENAKTHQYQNGRHTIAVVH
jgi:hypothetical protein